MVGEGKREKDLTVAPILCKGPQKFLFLVYAYKASWCGGDFSAQIPSPPAPCHVNAYGYPRGNVRLVADSSQVGARLFHLTGVNDSKNAGKFSE